MSEQDDETQPVNQPVSEPEPVAQPVTRAGWRERAYGVKGVAVVAVAGLIIGGGAGAAIHAATVDDDRGRDGRLGFGRGGPGGGMPGRMPGQMPGQGGPGQMPGQGGGPGQGQLPQPPNGLPDPPNGAPQQPTTPPEDSPTPDGSGATTSGDDT